MGGIDPRNHKFGLGALRRHCGEEEIRIEVRGISQLVNPNEMAERTLLPSCIYIPGEFDFPKGSTALPWEPEPKLVIGELARKRGAESPNRLIASAKSWLSYVGVDRPAPSLPWQASSASYHRSKPHRSSCNTCALCGTAVRQRTKGNSVLRNRTCCSRCQLRSTKGAN